MVSTLQLIRNEKAAASLFTIGSGLLIIASSLAFNIEIQKENKVNVKYTPSPAQITAFSFWLLTIGAIIGTVTAILRLNQLIQQSRSGTTTLSIWPSVLIAGGFGMLLIGLFAIAVGSQQRVNEESQTVIF